MRNVIYAFFANTQLRKRKLDEVSGSRGRGRKEGMISAISVGFFLVLVGIIFLTTPNIIDRASEFFRDLNATQVPNTNVILPAPLDPSAHVEIYSAVALFALVLGIFEVALLAMRFYVHSPIGKKADTAGDALFWLGTYYLITTVLTETVTITTWFAFWSEIIMLIGFSLIIRAVILASMRLKA